METLIEQRKTFIKKAKQKQTELIDELRYVLLSIMNDVASNGKDYAIIRISKTCTAFGDITGPIVTKATKQLADAYDIASFETFHPKINQDIYTIHDKEWTSSPTCDREYKDILTIDFE